MHDRQLSARKAAVTAAVSLALSGLMWVILIAHTAWGDERYVLKEDARLEAIAEMDDQLAIKDTEILFAEDDREKEKLIALRKIYERRKDALKEMGKDKG